MRILKVTSGVCFHLHWKHNFDIMLRKQNHTLKNQEISGVRLLDKLIH